MRSGYSEALEDFRRARRQADLEMLMARFTGKSLDLLSFDEVRHKLRATNVAERGLQDVPIDAIVGSAGRYGDFTRTFLPRESVDQQRWARVKQVTSDLSAASLPPVELYKIGAVYFVRDGHHRISVARRLGAETIPAYVTEVHTRVPLGPDVQPDELIVKAEYAEFLEATRLDTLRPGADLSLSEPGGYAKLRDHIDVHRYVMESQSGREVSDSEAITSWYDHAYLPVVQVIRERGMLRDFPGRTETDLYLWVAENRERLRHQLGWSVKPEAVVADLAAKFSPQRRSVGQRLFSLMVPASLTDGPQPGQWRKERLESRYLTQLFETILVPLNGEPGSWAAFEQALAIARRESSNLMGLHVVPTDLERTSEAALAVQHEFQRRCEAAPIAGALAVEVGEIASRICERATLADLVVLHLAHPPSAQLLERLGSGFRGIIRRCPRPVLAVPRQAMPMQRLLLAFDGSPKSKEALFVATYMVEAWKASLTVVSVHEADHPTPSALHAMREYLAFHEITADVVEASGSSAEVILRTADERDCNLILMGGYGARPLVEAVVGSTVDQVLRQSPRPVLICR